MAPITVVSSSMHMSLMNLPSERLETRAKLKDPTGGSFHQDVPLLHTLHTCLKKAIQNYCGKHGTLIVQLQK